MKKCLGCKHLSYSKVFCLYDVHFETATDPYTGVVRNIPFDSKGKFGWAVIKTPEEARSRGQLCGPEALKYEPTWLARLFPWWYS